MKDAYLFVTATAQIDVEAQEDGIMVKILVSPHALGRPSAAKLIRAFNRLYYSGR